MSHKIKIPCQTWLMSNGVRQENRQTCSTRHEKDGAINMGDRANCLLGVRPVFYVLPRHPRTGLPRRVHFVRNNSWQKAACAQAFHE